MAASEEELLLLGLFGEDAERLLRAIRGRASRRRRRARQRRQGARRADPRARAHRPGVGHRRADDRGGRDARLRARDARRPRGRGVRRRRSRSRSRRPRRLLRPSNGYVAIESPMVGTFYRAPEPGAPPFVEVGDVVARRADALHPRGDEAHERGEGRPRGDRARDPRRQRAAGRVRPGAFDLEPLDRARPARRSLMFSRVLVANRGEIAVRVIRALHELGIEAVAVYSTADEDALHVRLADRAVRSARRRRRRATSSIPAIVAAATTTGCEAVHPGYGFLSENADFVRACEDNDLVFIGPPADVMERMGDKAQAKAEMRAAGVPLVPGTEGTASLDEARVAADELGYPGAAEGGGGRRRARHAARRERRPRSTTRTRAPSAEAEAAFSDGTLYVEKAITPARHVEIQVLCDAHGNVLTLRRARVLDPAPPSEADRGVAVARARSRAARGDGVRRGARVRAHRLSQRGHVRVPRRSGRRVLVHRAECAPPGRASGDRARDVARPRAHADRGSLPASGSRSRRPRAARRGTRSRCASTPRIRAHDFAPVARAARRASGRRSVPACASTRSSRRAPSSRRTTTR